MHITAMGGGGVMEVDEFWRAFRHKGRGRRRGASLFVEIARRVTERESGQRARKQQGR
jgi:hypothetical protein